MTRLGLHPVVILSETKDLAESRCLHLGIDPSPGAQDDNVAEDVKVSLTVHLGADVLGSALFCARLAAMA